MTNAEWPRWMRELEAAVHLAPEIVLWGNTRDRVLVRGDGEPELMSLNRAIWLVLQRAGFTKLFVVDRIRGLREELGEVWSDGEGEEALDDMPPLYGGREFRHVDLLEFARWIDTRQSGQVGARPAGLVIDYATRLARDPQRLEDDEHLMYAGFLELSHRAEPLYDAESGSQVHNVAIWITQGENDLPDWFVNRNEGVRRIAVPMPDLDDRVAAAQLLAPDLRVDDPAGFAKEFSATALGLTLAGMEGTVGLARARSMAPDEIDEAVIAYRHGFSENPWKQPQRLQRIADGAETLRSRVHGQDAAIRDALDMLMRSAAGLTGSHSEARGSRPRGVLVFAGPTGVGKTELAKALTNLIFGTDDAYIRLDMSEYSSEHNEARLIGAPPGYVGYDAGGQLTSKVRARPFSLVLFDEIDKAHPRILDKFLQILEDGRLTDGSGNTVFFGETVLVFTTNKGMVDQAGRAIIPWSADLRPGDLRGPVEEAIKAFFFDIQRPEIHNRLGQNIIVFDYIQRPVAETIFAAKLAAIRGRVREEHRIEIELAEAVGDALRDHCIADLEYGGRGIVNELEKAFVNPLSRWVFQVMAGGRTGPATWTVTGWTESDDGYELEIDT